MSSMAHRISPYFWSSAIVVPPQRRQSLGGRYSPHVTKDRVAVNLRECKGMDLALVKGPNDVVRRFRRCGETNGLKKCSRGGRNGSSGPPFSVSPEGERQGRAPAAAKRDRQIYGPGQARIGRWVRQARCPH